MTKYLIIVIMLINTTIMYAQSEKMQNNSDRYTRGWNKLQEIDGEAGERVINGLKDISPDLGRFIIEYSFGDIYNLPLLDNKSKEVAAVASLIAQRASPEMKVHFNGALNSGCTVAEVKELVLHMSAYVGFPKTICAMNTLKEVLADRKTEGINDAQGEETIINDNHTRYQRGSEYLSRLNKNQEEIMKNAYNNFSPELVRFVIEYGYGDIYARETLDKRYRQIATIAALATIGNAPSQLNFHISGGLNIGITVDEMKELMLLMSVYAGFPASINGMDILKIVVSNQSDK